MFEFQNFLPYTSKTDETIEERALYIDTLIWERNYVLSKKNKTPKISDYELYLKMKVAYLKKFSKRLKTC